MKTMKTLQVITLCLFCAFLVDGCSSKAKGGASDVDDEVIGEGELAEGLNSITYRLDWSTLKDGIKPVVENDFHLLKWNETVEREVEVYGVDSLDSYIETVSEQETKTTTYRTSQWRFVLDDGQKVMYRPDLTIDDLWIVAAKEVIINLARAKMYSDPRIKQDKDMIGEIVYYLLYRDKSVRQDVKAMALEHYQAACDAFETEGELEKIIGTSRMRVFYRPSSTPYNILVMFGYDKDGYLRVRSTDTNQDPTDDNTWTFAF